MSAHDVLPAPQIGATDGPGSKWERERRAFLRMRESLLRTHRGKYVAIHEEQLVDSDENDVALGLRAYERFGYVPIYVELVTDSPAPPVRIPSPRIWTDSIAR